MDKHPFDYLQGQIQEMRARFLISLQRGDLMRILEKAVDFLKVQGNSPENGKNSGRSLGRASGGLALPGVPLARPPSAEGRREAAVQSAPGMGQLPFWAPLLPQPSGGGGGRAGLC